jgi:hypothetical integral membrane protein (TIGR02206 family)
MNDFRSFSWLHLVTLIGIAALAALVILIARRVRSAERLSAIDIMLGAGALAVWILQDGSKLLPANFHVATTLPIEVCDLAALIAPLALLLRRRWLYALLYFWGIGLSSQGLFTPELHDGPASLHFWLFFFRHGAIVGGGVYVILVHDFRPTWRDWRIATLAGLAYIALVLPLDILLSANYGYVGNAKPDTASLIDYFGPWPWRVLAMAVIATVIFTMLELPWALARAAHRRTELRAAAT